MDHLQTPSRLPSQSRPPLDKQSSSSLRSHQSTKRKRASLLSLEQRLNNVLDFARDQNLKFDQLIYEFFRTPSAQEKDEWNDEDHRCFSSRAAIVSSFLNGKSTHTSADVLDLWMCHPYGAKDKFSPEMYSLASARPYTTIRAVRPALTSFGVQIVQRQLRSQMREAVKPSSGLHVHIPSRKNPISSSDSEINWRTLGVQTFQHVTDIHKKFQPLLWGLLCEVATPASCRDRERRPLETVCYTISSYRSYAH